MKDWILLSDKKPENGEHIYYYFELLGVFEGHYKEYFFDELDTWEEVFHSDHGFLSGGEVTHWMPYSENKPSPPR